MCSKHIADFVALFVHRAVLMELLTSQATLSSSTLHRVFLNKVTFNSSNTLLSRTMDLSLCTNKESHQQEQTMTLPV